MAEDIIRTTQREVLNRYNFADYHPLSDNPYGNSKAIGLLRTIENLKKKEDNECFENKKIFKNTIPLIDIIANVSFH